MKGLRAWQGFYLDLQRRILKRRFSERPDCSTPGLQFQNADKLWMEPFLHPYFSSFLPSELLQISESGIKPGIYRSHWCIHASYYQGTALFPQRALNRANNEPLHPNPHPLGQRSTQAGVLRVKELAYQSPSNHRTHKTPCRTTSHLEDISGTAKREGGFLRSSELWDGTPELP